MNEFTSVEEGLTVELERYDTSPAAVARNYLQGCLLLLLAESPTHGYDLLPRLGEMGIPKVDSGALYRTLRGLNDDGLVESWWDKASSGPARRTYRVTDRGIEHLSDWADTVAVSTSFLRSFVVRHRQLQRWGADGARPSVLVSDEGAA